MLMFGRLRLILKIWCTSKESNEVESCKARIQKVIPACRAITYYPPRIFIRQVELAKIDLLYCFYVLVDILFRVIKYEIVPSLKYSRSPKSRSPEDNLQEIFESLAIGLKTLQLFVHMMFGHVLTTPFRLQLCSHHFPYMQWMKQQLNECNSVTPV